MGRLDDNCPLRAFLCLRMGFIAPQKQKREKLGLCRRPHVELSTTLHPDLRPLVECGEGETSPPRRSVMTPSALIVDEPPPYFLQVGAYGHPRNLNKLNKL